MKSSATVPERRSSSVQPLGSAATSRRIGWRKSESMRYSSSDGASVGLDVDRDAEVRPGVVDGVQLVVRVVVRGERVVDDLRAQHPVGLQRHRRLTRGDGSRSMPSVDGVAHTPQPLHLALELGRRVAVHVGVRAHLARVPEVRRLVDALEPRHAAEGLRDEHDDVLRPALALRRRAARVGDARAPEHGAIEPPAVPDPVEVALELSEV